MYNDYIKFRGMCKGSFVMRFAVYTLGCKVNQVESQALEREGLRRGHVLVGFSEEADAYLINTCTVTAVSDQKNRQIIRRARNGHPQAVVAVCGCFPQTHPGVAEELGADLVMGTGDRGQFWTLLEQVAASRQRVSQVDDVMKRREFELLPAGGLVGRTRAMLKVEDGCRNFCSYCIIPYARGPVRSLPLDAAAEQASRLAAEGYRELVVTGIEISSWGLDLPQKPGLAELLEGVSAAATGVRLRLGSLEPRTVTEEFCERVSRLPNLCPHFHLSLQSGSDDTLKRMNRKYNSERYLRSVDLLRKYFHNPGITTDLIVGFPGETEETFQESLDFVEKCAFSAIHVFPYSRRPGTPADKMPGQVPSAEKKRRAAVAGQLAADLKRRFLDGLVGSAQEVLFEEQKDAHWVGHAPNYVQVRLPESGENLHNHLRRVKIISATQEYLVGELLD